MTHEENEAAFRAAPSHSVESAVWLLLYRRGIVSSPDIDLNNPLLDAIVERKAVLHMDLLQAHGIEVPGASATVRYLEKNGLDGMQALASGARRDEIKVFLDRYDLNVVFPSRRIVAKGDYTHAKPHPEPFNVAYNTLGLPDSPALRARTLAIEDDPKGVESALRAGLYICALTTRCPADNLVVDGQRPNLIAANMQELGEMLGIPASVYS